MERLRIASGEVKAAGRLRRQRWPALFPTLANLEGLIEHVGRDFPKRIRRLDAHIPVCVLQGDDQLGHSRFRRRFKAGQRPKTAAADLSSGIAQSIDKGRNRDVRLASKPSQRFCGPSRQICILVAHAFTEQLDGESPIRSQVVTRDEEPGHICAPGIARILENRHQRGHSVLASAIQRV